MVVIQFSFEGRVVAGRRRSHVPAWGDIVNLEGAEYAVMRRVWHETPNDDGCSRVTLTLKSRPPELEEFIRG